MYCNWFSFLIYLYIHTKRCPSTFAPRAPAPTNRGVTAFKSTNDPLTWTPLRGSPPHPEIRTISPVGCHRRRNTTTTTTQYHPASATILIIMSGRKENHRHHPKRKKTDPAKSPALATPRTFIRSAPTAAATITSTTTTAAPSSRRSLRSSAANAPIRRVRHAEIVLVDDVCVAHGRYWLRLRWPGHQQQQSPHSHSHGSGGSSNNSLFAGYIAMGLVSKEEAQDDVNDDLDGMCVCSCKRTTKCTAVALFCFLYSDPFPIFFFSLRIQFFQTRHTNNNCIRSPKPKTGRTKIPHAKRPPPCHPRNPFRAAA